MGRTLKRVPLDFDWPMNVTWKGFINPYNAINCTLCDGSGYNKETKELSDDFYDFNRKGTKWNDKITQEEVEHLVEKGRLSDFLEHWYSYNEEKETWEFLDRSKKDRKWKPCEKPMMPTAEKVNEVNRGVSLGSHDAINRSFLLQFRAKKLGIYGLCELCEGNGYYYTDDKIGELAEAWESFEPPKGKGYQMWETCSEGSPQSPVFRSLDELCEWLEESNASWFGYETATKEEWKQSLDDGTAGIMMMVAPRKEMSAYQGVDDK